MGTNMRRFGKGVVLVAMVAVYKLLGRVDKQCRVDTHMLAMLGRLDK
jgi:hypothetical protein